MAIVGFDDSSGVFVVVAALKEAKHVTKSNPFQGDDVRARSESVEYNTERGERLQGAVRHTARYEAGKKYPMIVYVAL